MDNDGLYKQYIRNILSINRNPVIICVKNVFPTNNDMSFNNGSIDGFPYYEICTKTGYGIENIFTYFITLINSSKSTI